MQRKEVTFDGETYVFHEPTFQDAIDLEKMGFDILSGSKNSDLTNTELTLALVNILKEGEPLKPDETPLRMIKVLGPIIQEFFEELGLNEEPDASNSFAVSGSADVNFAVAERPEQQVGE